MNLLPNGWAKTFLLLTGLTATTLHAAAQEYLRVQPRTGDNVKSLLAHYGLDGYSCNREAFFTINGLPADAMLAVNQPYLLPIQVFAYNGKSIRTTIGITDFEKAVRIQQFNENAKRNGAKGGHYSVDMKLWVPHHEMGCKGLPATTPPPTSVAVGAKLTFPIFGTAYQHVTVKNNRLKGNVFYISSGHGGPDPGAIAKIGGKSFCEDEYAYDISLRFARNLIEHGATVYIITRDPNDGIRNAWHLPPDADEVCWQNQRIPKDQKARLTQRADAINRLRYHYKLKGITKQYSIMIHIDSRASDKRIDLFFYHHPTSTEGKRLATSLLKTIRDKYNQAQKGRGYDGVVKGRDLFMLRETRTASVYLELGNIKNTADQPRFFDQNNRQALANWLTEGVLKW